MKSILQALWHKVWPKHLKKDFEIPVHLLTDAEATKKFDSVSKFIFDTQKLYFESLKFSLNMWTIISSGAAFAIFGNDMNSNKIASSSFMIGALFSGALNILLSQYIASLLNLYSCSAIDRDSNTVSMLKQHIEKNKRFQKNITYFLFVIYTVFSIGVSALIFL